MYYLVLLVYASIYATELISGGEASEALRSNLANDHAAVAAGDALRLFTSAFVTTSLRQLGVTLLCFFTVGSELEALLGNGVYWALLCLSVVAGGFADAALSPQPITSGPAPIIASLVAALLAYHIKNWRIEAQLQQLREARDAVFGTGGRTADMTPSVARKRLTAMLTDLAGDPPLLNPPAGGAAGASPASSATGGEGSAGRSAASGGDLRGLGDLQETKIQVIDGIWEPTVLLPREAKAFVTLAGLSTACFSALRDAVDAANYSAMAAAFVFGGLLGYAVAPSWRVEYELASKEGEGGGGGGGDGAAGWRKRGAGAGGGESVSSLDGGLGVYWRPALADAMTGRARANAIVGGAGVLYAALGLWLLLAE
ncbi:hypothetical protein MNEG_8379 [Monoraphidium neglectum]|uniref:Peptidase S54 rhomboid domain-containing protein n=1 Tax=Monoraphidium neglectum TaxID=145388 RepID=A0A0D2JJX5_9CHLO|nr:hypothetical protein MNEG_8379 [Monoraphidium neglectum]KIY99582.1 hypothetical protein MNEG_8379 [Monoraphidium neglectum]|eukprot:XP_013898602.1 hypothetical protein MNEG_8379 [Monoraphidium neglectum]